MAGTTIPNLKLTKVVDGDTVKVEIDGKEESLRLICLDTEESRPGGNKPVTNAGQLASKWAKSFFGVDEDGLPTGPITVDIEFDTSDPIPVCLAKHRGNYGRLICYVHKQGVNYNLKAVEEGWSPYFVKYGQARLYHEEFMAAEASAQARRIAIWDPDINAGGNRRDYNQLLPWWYLRNSVVENYRKFGIQSGTQSVRLDYDAIVQAAESGSPLTVLCDLQAGINKWPGDGALIYAGSPTHKFNLWIPDRDSSEAEAILNLIETRYAGYGRSYVYVSGNASLYPPQANGKPQIVVKDRSQLSDLTKGK